MEAPNEDTTMSPKIGLEGYCGDKAGSNYDFVTSDGICRTTIPTPFPIKESQAACYSLTLEPGVCCKLEYTDETIMITTGNIPSRSQANLGATFGIKTLNEEEKNLSVMSAGLQYNETN